MKRMIRTIVFVLIFTSGLLLMLYPTLSDWISRKHQSSVIADYDRMIINTEKTKMEKQKETATEYNQALVGNVILTDPFDAEALQEINKDYSSYLNLNKDGVMGVLKIPSIDVNLPIYHGTSKEVLEKGIGHLENSSLPVGGPDTHTVLSGHTGLPTSKLFNDLEQLEVGDTFYLYVLDEVLAYQVDQIKVVDPNQTEDLLIQLGQDYVTLITCTPYGVNSHRLLVRGSRVPYSLEQEAEMRAQMVEEVWWMKYVYYFMFSLVIVALVFLVRKRIRKKKRGDCRG